MVIFLQILWKGKEAHVYDRDLMDCYVDKSVEQQYAQIDIFSNKMRQFENSVLSIGRDLEMLRHLSQMGQNSFDIEQNSFDIELNNLLTCIINDYTRNLFNSLHTPKWQQW